MSDNELDRRISNLQSLVGKWSAEERAWEQVLAGVEKKTAAKAAADATAQLSAADHQFAVHQSALSQIPNAVQRCLGTLDIGIDNFEKTNRAVETVLKGVADACKDKGKKVGEGAFAGYPKVDNPKALLKGMLLSL